MGKGELATLRFRYICEEIGKRVKDVVLDGDPAKNTITLKWADGTVIVVRPISISPVK